jgi:hypothetical protein
MNHSICDDCWLKRNSYIGPDGAMVRVPVRITEPELEICCYCGIRNRDGIYVRAGSAPCGKMHA